MNEVGLVRRLTIWVLAKIGLWAIAEEQRTVSYTPDATWRGHDRG